MKDKRIFVAAALMLALTAMVFAEPLTPQFGKQAEIKEIELKEGWYAFRGNKGEVGYAGMATVRKIGEQYIVRWFHDGGASTGTVVVATGFHTGDIFSVGWAARPGRCHRVYGPEGRRPVRSLGAMANRQWRETHRNQDMGGEGLLPKIEDSE